MGNAPSKPGSTSGTSQHSSLGNDKKVNRRTSIHALSSGKAAAADPSPSKESALGYSASQRKQPPLQQRLQSRHTVAESPIRDDTLERYDSRKAREGSEIDLPSHPKDTTPVQPSRAVQVPDHRDQQSSSRPPLNTYYTAPSHLARPPRLPLPIGDAMTAPGSPITASGSLGAAAAFDNANLEVSPEKSDLGGSLADDEELGDGLGSYSSNEFNKAVSTKIEWRGGGEKVYVTGTFVNWARKFKLQKSDAERGVFTANLQLRPGTHHLKFIVDGTMRTSEQLPTAVDFTNHLVNYVEISADEIRPRRESDKQPKVIIPPGIYPPKVLPESLPIDTTESQDESEKEEPEEEIPMGDFRHIIPQFLVDIDKEEGGAEYQQAANVIGDCPAPPMLPLFLARSILNGTTPMKDDNSVLNYPNHTVLNHLATSSIKNGVLATSVTTRYKRKYVTTILYKPTN